MNVLMLVLYNGVGVMYNFLEFYIQLHIFNNCGTNCTWIWRGEGMCLACSRLEAGAKLAPFNSGGCLPELPCQNRWCPAANFYFWVPIFPKNVGEQGGGGGWKIFFCTLKKGSKNFSGHEPLKLTVKTIFPYKFLLKHAWKHYFLN